MVGLTQLSSICPPVCLPCHIYSSCTRSVGMGCQHVKTCLEEEQTYPSAKPHDHCGHRLTELLLTVRKEEVQSSFGLQSDEHLPLKGVSPMLSVYFRAVFMSCHHKLTCSCTMNWPGELICLKTHPAEKKKKKGKSYFAASSTL